MYIGLNTSLLCQGYVQTCCDVKLCSQSPLLLCDYWWPFNPPTWVFYRCAVNLRSQGGKPGRGYVVKTSIMYMHNVLTVLWTVHTVYKSLANPQLSKYCILCAYALNSAHGVVNFLGPLTLGVHVQRDLCLLVSCPDSTHKTKTT